MASVATTPVKYAPADWHTSNEVIRSSAERQRSMTHQVRQESHRTRNETDATTKWTQYNTDTNLHNRLSDVTDWKNTVDTTLTKTEREMEQLSKTKRIAEYSLQSKMMPLDIALECLTTREGRIGIDSVRDDIEAELKKEVDVIEGIQALLYQRVNQAHEQLKVLKDCYEKLHYDSSDKSTALSIDSDCAGLTNKSSNISLHKNSTRIKIGIATPRQWDAFSHHNTTKAEEEMERSIRLRETINHTIQQTTNDLESQWNASNYALRVRVHEMELAKKELEYQRKTTKDEIARVEQEIEDLENALAAKHPPMMVAQTRLENRTFRPNIELCRDKPQYGLVEEVATITTSKHQLSEKLDTAKKGLGTLQRTLARIEEDISIKTTSLHLDQHCENIRLKLVQHPKPRELPGLALKDTQ